MLDTLKAYVQIDGSYYRGKCQQNEKQLSFEMVVKLIALKKNLYYNTELEIVDLFTFQV